MPPRVERDFAGEVLVPSDALDGAQTQRAVEAFTISDLRLPPEFIASLGAIKGAAAEANLDLGRLSPGIAEAIIEAAAEVEAGQLNAHFVIDVFQTGSGTNTNMNANEVIANRANQLLGKSLGSRTPVHPNDHVNLGQSSNDVIPTTIHVAASTLIAHELLPSLRHLRLALDDRAAKFDHVVKTGRTHLQDAVPIRLGQEFTGYAGQIERGTARVRAAKEELAEVALGGTAIGTGLNTAPEFAPYVCRRLSERLGIKVRETENHFQAQSSLDAAVSTSGTLKTLAVSLIKICNDIRWMSSGPRAGLAEIEIPTLSMASSIMPAKTNPIIPEAVCQVAARVIGNDATITLGGQYGNFEINVMMPLIGFALLESIRLLAASCRVLADRCLSGMNATERGPATVERGLMLATALSPRIGYEAAAAIAHEAQALDTTVRAVAEHRTSLSSSELDALLDPRLLTGR